MLIKTSKKSEPSRKRIKAGTETIRFVHGIQPNDERALAAAAEFRERKQHEAESHSELQRAKTMTREERSREAQDIMTREHVEHFKTIGREITETEARARVQKIAEAAERKQDG